MELVETEPADQPLCIQLYGHEPDEMANAAQWCEENGAVVIDINMGCPVDKVCKKNGGSALLRDPMPAAAAALAAQVVRAVKVPVTVKMRLGWDHDHIVAPQLAAVLEEVGIAGVTVHGRTAAQKFSGKASLEGIARVVETVKRIPVIGNGDICHPHDARRMLDQTGCAGVMIGRAALSDPWLFRDTHAYLTHGQIPAPPTAHERIALMNTHFGHLMRIRGERLACMIFRQRVSWYIKKLPPCPQFRERIRFIQTAAEYRTCIESLHVELRRNASISRSPDQRLVFLEEVPLRKAGTFGGLVLRSLHLTPSPTDAATDTPASGARGSSRCIRAAPAALSRRGVYRVRARL
jgi:nifR3 family TIM-barrel protein